MSDMSYEHQHTAVTPIRSRRDAVPTPPWWPDTVIVDDEAADDPMTRRVLSRLEGARIVRTAGRGDPIAEQGIFDRETAGMLPSERFTFGKRKLFLTRHRGAWLKGCPGTSGHVCCNLYIVNPGEGCPLDCTYCYLQSYLKRNPTLKIYTNTAELVSAIREQTAASPARLFRVGTGEVIDSLIWDRLTDLSCELVPLFAELPNATLELKTKSAEIANLLAMESVHGGKTVVSWSVNAAAISAREEAFTAPLEERIACAARLAGAGYRVGFHLDPLIVFEGWQDGYRDTIQRILEAVPAEMIAWVSVSSLRYHREMQGVMMERFPESRIPFGEHFLAKDDKLRYVQPVRFQLLRFVWNELKNRVPALPVYMCMESSAAWHEVAGGPPVAGSELVEIFSRRGRLPLV